MAWEPVFAAPCWLGVDLVSWTTGHAALTSVRGYSSWQVSMGSGRAGCSFESASRCRVAASTSSFGDFERESRLGRLWGTGSWSWPLTTASRSVRWTRAHLQTAGWSRRGRPVDSPWCWPWSARQLGQRHRRAESWPWVREGRCAAWLSGFVVGNGGRGLVSLWVARHGCSLGRIGEETRA